MTATPVTIGDATLYCGDVIEVLKSMDAESVQCVVTSPPYWGLRDYGTATWEGGNSECDHKIPANGSTQNKSNNNREGKPFVGTCGKCGAIRHDNGIGLEPTFQEWVDRMVAVCEEIKRVLRDDGTFWLNCGDAYANTCTGGNGATGGLDKSTLQTRMPPIGTTPTKKSLSGFKAKDLMMMPARLAIALQEAGWWVRSEIIWAKPNPMPESCTDRPTSSHEKIYLLTKSGRYFYDADAVRENQKDTYLLEGGRNLRNVWTIATQPYPEAHFATFPEALPMKCIMAGTSEKGCCPECGAPWVRVVESTREIETETCSSWDIASGGHGTVNRQGRSEKEKRIQEIPTAFGWQPSCACGGDPIPCTVLDPFSGSARTGLVALKLNRKYIGIELNPEYIELSVKQIQEEADQGKLF